MGEQVIPKEKQLFRANKQSPSIVTSNYAGDLALSRPNTRPFSFRITFDSGKKWWLQASSIDARRKWVQMIIDIKRSVEKRNSPLLPRSLNPSRSMFELPSSFSSASTNDPFAETCSGGLTNSDQKLELSSESTATVSVAALIVENHFRAPSFDSDKGNTKMIKGQSQASGLSTLHNSTKDSNSNRPDSTAFEMDTRSLDKNVDKVCSFVERVRSLSPSMHHSAVAPNFLQKPTGRSQRQRSSILAHCDISEVKKKLSLIAQGDFPNDHEENDSISSTDDHSESAQDIIESETAQGLRTRVLKCGLVTENQQSVIQTEISPISCISGEIVLKQLSLGESHVLLLSDTGDVFSWGNGTRYQLGLGMPLSEVDKPQLVRTLALVKALQGKYIVNVACGGHHSVAVTNDGELYSWGMGTEGQLGHNARENQPLPRLCIGLLGHLITKVACGGSHSVAIAVDGTVFTWGRGKNGRLGHGNEETHIVPCALRTLPANLVVTEVACGWSFTVMKGSDGSVFTCGKGSNGQCGYREALMDLYTPTLVDALQGRQVADISCGYKHVMARCLNGDLFAWGSGTYGQLGLGEHVTQLQEPEMVRIPSSYGYVLAVYCGAFHTIVTTSTQHILAWGFNQYSSLGLGHTSNIARPQSIVGLSARGIIQIACGMHFTLFLQQLVTDGKDSKGSNMFTMPSQLHTDGASLPMSNVSTSKGNEEREREKRMAKITKVNIMFFSLHTPHITNQMCI